MWFIILATIVLLLQYWQLTDYRDTFIPRLIENNTKIINNVIYLHDRLIDITSETDKVNKIQIPIFYINLGRVLDRNNNMINQLSANKISNYYRIEAIDGIYLSNHKYINKLQYLTNSEIACMTYH